MSGYSDWKERAKERRKERAERGEGSGTPQKRSKVTHKTKRKERDPSKRGSFQPSWDETGSTSKKDRQKKEDERKARNKENLRKTIEDLYGPIPESVGICSNWRKELYDC